jgi:DNA-directed RNA polymerase subunit L
MGRTLFRGTRMKIKVLERTSNKLKIEIEGVGHSFCNVLQKALLDEDGIDITGYNQPHPLVSNPIVYVQTKGQLKPEIAIQNAVKRIRKQNKDFRKIFEKALKERPQKLPATTSSKSSESKTTHS